MLDAHCDDEIWRSVTLPEFSGLYQVSSHGRVRSLDHYASAKLGSKKFFKGMLLKLQVARGGYLRAKLCNGKQIKRPQVHRLVALAFIPNPEKKLQVNHKDGRVQNNDVGNLEWSSARENLIHSHNFLKTIRTQKEVMQYSLTGELLAVWPSATEASRVLGLNRSGISQACKNGRRSAYGFVWKAADPTDRRSYRKKIAQMTARGRIIKIWPTLRAAALGVGCGVSTIDSALRGALKTCKSFRWKYVE